MPERNIYDNLAIVIVLHYFYKNFTLTIAVPHQGRKKIIDKI